MTIQSSIILLIIAASAALSLMHTIHRKKINRSEIFIPDMVEVHSLERDLDRIQEIRHGIADADGSLRGRINALTVAVNRLEKEKGRISPDSTTSAFLKIRESSEKTATQHLEKYTARRQERI